MYNVCHAYSSCKLTEMPDCPLTMLTAQKNKIVFNTKLGSVITRGERLVNKENLVLSGWHLVSKWTWNKKASAWPRMSGIASLLGH